MERDDIIRAIVRVGGMEIFNLFPKFIEKPFEHIGDLQTIAKSFAYMKCTDLKMKKELGRQICEKYTSFLNVPKLPAGGAALAAIIEQLSVCLNDKSFPRGIWLELARNKRYFIRRRFVKLLRDDLTQQEANELWRVYCEKGDWEILRNLILSDSSIEIPIEVIEDIAEDEGEGYLLSRAMAHEINSSGKVAFDRFRQRFPVSTIYAAGFSGVLDLTPELIRLAENKKVSEEERKSAIWALSRLGNKEAIFKIAVKILK